MNKKRQVNHNKSSSKHNSRRNKSSNKDSININDITVTEKWSFYRD